MALSSHFCLFLFAPSFFSSANDFLLLFFLLLRSTTNYTTFGIRNICCYTNDQPWWTTRIRKSINDNQNENESKLKTRKRRKMYIYLITFGFRFRLDLSPANAMKGEIESNQIQNRSNTGRQNSSIKYQSIASALSLALSAIGRE